MNLICSQFISRYIVERLCLERTEVFIYLERTNTLEDRWVELYVYAQVGFLSEVFNARKIRKKDISFISKRKSDMNDKNERYLPYGVFVCVFEVIK